MVRWVCHTLHTITSAQFFAALIIVANDCCISTISIVPSVPSVLTIYPSNHDESLSKLALLLLGLYGFIPFILNYFCFVFG